MPRPVIQLTAKRLQDAMDKAGSAEAASRLLFKEGLEVSPRTIRRRLSDKEFVVSEVPDPVNIKQVLQRRYDDFDQRRKFETASHIRTVHLRTNQPIGIGFQGDGHLDDPGTDLREFFNHAEIFDGRHKGLHLAFLGDIFNNWVGRLTTIFSKQSTTTVEAQALIKHYCEMCDFLFVILGNHDLWNQKEDMLQYLFKAATDICVPHEQRVKLVFPNGREVTIHARHKFPGHSQWTTQFGQIKAAQLDGQSDIYVGGDKHVSGYSNGIHPGTKKMYHALQVASYKIYDDYPVELGLAPKQLYVCPVAIINPKAKSSVNFVRFEFDPYEGAERLAWERSRSS